MNPMQNSSFTSHLPKSSEVKYNGRKICKPAQENSHMHKEPSVKHLATVYMYVLNNPKTDYENGTKAESGIIMMKDKKRILLYLGIYPPFQLSTWL